MIKHTSEIIGREGKWHDKLHSKKVIQFTNNFSFSKMESYCCGPMAESPFSQK